MTARDEILARLSASEQIRKRPKVSAAQEAAPESVGTVSNGAPESELRALLASRLEEAEAYLFRAESPQELQTIIWKLLGEECGVVFVADHPLTVRGEVRRAVEACGGTVWGDDAFAKDERGIIRLAEAAAAVTGCDAVLAEPGSVVISSQDGGDRLSGVLTPKHIVLYSPDSVLPDLAGLFRSLRRSGAPRWLCLTTGSSRTADIEKQLVKPAHGAGCLCLVECAF